MSSKIWITSFVILLVLAGIFAAQPVNASPLAQVGYQTPTALPDGRVIYVVQAGETCLAIELKTKVDDNQLRTMNKLDQNCTLSVGRELILAIITPVPTSTTNPAFTATPLLPTPTVFKGNGKICVQIYKDLNGNGFQEDGETLMTGVASISDATGKVSKTGSTSDDATKPYCEEVPEGQYNVSMAVPDGYNATTGTSLLIKVEAGNTDYVDFGAQVSSKIDNPIPQATVTPPQPPQPNNMLLAVVGGLFLLAGAGLGIYVLVMRR